LLDGPAIRSLSTASLDRKTKPPNLFSPGQLDASPLQPNEGRAARTTLPQFDPQPPYLESLMLWTITIILFVLWLLGLVSGYTLSGWIHILLVLAIIVLIFNLLSGRRAL